MRIRSHSLPLLVGSAGLATVLGANAWWLRQNELPDGFQNEYEHVYTLTEVFFRLRDNSLSDAWSNLWDGYYPPLNSLVGSLGLSLFGSSLDVAIGSLALFLVLLVFVTGLLAGRLAGARVASLALAFTLLYPGLYGNARRFEPNIALAAMVALAVGWLALHPHLRRRRDAVILGLLFGAGMLTDRVVFIVYMAPPLGLVLYRLLKERRDLGERLARWGLVFGLMTLVCGYYYLRFVEGHLDEITTQIGGEITSAGDESPSHPPWTLLGLFYYPISWIDAQMGAVLGTLTLAGIALYVFLGRSSLDPRMRGLVEAWLFGGLLIITVVGKKQAFYSIPLLAPAAIFASVGWHSALRSHRVRAVFLCTVLALGGYQLSLLTLGPDRVPAPGHWSLVAGTSPLPRGLLGSEYTMASAPDPQGLQLERMAAQCRAHQEKLRSAGADLPYVVLFSNSQRAYEGQVMPTLRLAMDTLLVEGVVMNGEAVEDQGDRASCLLYLTDGDEEWPGIEDVRSQWAQWGVGVPGLGLQDRLEEMRTRVLTHESWMTRWDSRVHTFTLSSAPSSAPD